MAERNLGKIKAVRSLLTKSSKVHEFLKWSFGNRHIVRNLYLGGSKATANEHNL